MCRGERLQESLSRGRRGKLLANMLRLKFYLLPLQGYLETWQDFIFILPVTMVSHNHNTQYVSFTPHYLTCGMYRHFYLLMMVMINVYDVMIIERVVAYFLYTGEH